MKCGAERRKGELGISGNFETSNVTAYCADECLLLELNMGRKADLLLDYTIYNTRDIPQKTSMWGAGMDGICPGD